MSVQLRVGVGRGDGLLGEAVLGDLEDPGFVVVEPNGYMTG